MKLEPLGEGVLDLRPRSGKLELHLLYNCQLACRHCNRQSFLREAHTPPMTVDDVIEVLYQAQQLRWFPAILLIGGEPTLHPDFDRICELCREFANLGARLGLGYPEKGLQGLVQLWSNQTTPAAREAAARVRDRYQISVCEQTIKQGGTIPLQVYSSGEKEGYEFDIQDIMVSPADMGYTRTHCWQHGAEICGISVDSQGYSPCSTGGAVAGMLGLQGVRTKVLADLFDPEKVAEMTRKLCAHCGNCASRTGVNGCGAEEWREKMASLPRWRGMPVSPTWQRALEGRQ